MFLRIEDAVLSEAAELPLSGFGPVFKPFSNSTAEEARCQLVGKRLRQHRKVMTTNNTKCFVELDKLNSAVQSGSDGHSTEQSPRDRFNNCSMKLEGFKIQEQLDISPNETVHNNSVENSNREHGGIILITDPNRNKMKKFCERGEQTEDNAEKGSNVITQYASELANSENMNEPEQQNLR